MIRRSALVWMVTAGCTAGSPTPVAPVTPPRAAAPSSIAAKPGDLAITDASVVPMSSEGILAHHTVVIRGDRIVAIAPTAMVALPSGVTVIDGTGKWLMPGLADMHVHTWNEDDLIMFLAAGVTTIRNMWGTTEHVTWRQQIARGERLGPTIVTAGDLIDGEPVDWPGSAVLTNPGAADALVRAQKAAGYDFLKPVSRLSREAYAALAAAGQRHGLVLAGHVPVAIGLAGALAAHQRSIEHLDGYLAALVPPGPPLPSVDDDDWTRAVLSRLDPSRLPALIDQTIAAGTWNCPTLIAYDRAAELYDVDAIQRRVRWLDLLPAAVRVGWVQDFAAQHPTAEAKATGRAFNARLAQIAAALAAANAPILIGTDTGTPFVVPGEALHDEIELIVAAGVPRPRVLRAATADAWRYLGLPHEAGVVEVGARADLVLVATDPLAAPLPLVPDGVVVRGRWLPRPELERRLAEVANHGASPHDRWEAAPPIAVDGTAVHRAGYDRALAGTIVGQERLAIGGSGGKRMIAGQLADFTTGLDTSYQVAPATAAVAATYRTWPLAITGTLTAGALVVTGTDLRGRPVSLREPVPAGAFLSAPGIGGAFQLAAQLTGMKPGGQRTLASVELGYFPRIAIVATRYAVARRPDRDGHRVFAVAATARGATLTEELVVDAAGDVVAQTLGPPLATTITRRPQ